MEDWKDEKSNVDKEGPHEPLSVLSGDVILRRSTSGGLTYPELPLGDIAVLGIKTTIHHHVENDDPSFAKTESVAESKEAILL